ncbi:MAG: RnfABCDGE type electron transport complex subunit D [Pseudomonadota bacterium]
MKFEAAITPYLRPSAGVGAVMLQVLYALVPAVLAHCWYFGPGIVINIIVATTAAVATEALILRAKGSEPIPAISDFTAVLTAVLIAFALPPLTPWWITATASVIAIAVAKHLYGGLGKNPFNPAMVGYAAALVSFPVELSAWLPPKMGDLDYTHPSLMQTLRYTLTGDAGVAFDALTRATPLDSVRVAFAESRTMSESAAAPWFGDFAGRGWEWINNYIALGGMWMLFRRIIRWQIPVAVLAGALIPATIASLISPDNFAGPGFHLFAGALMLGAFFIATDPVSGATTPRGRLLYGFGIGVLTWIIRTWGAYPDGVAFAVLLMNMAVPLIDRVSRPRVLGRE